MGIGQSKPNNQPVQTVEESTTNETHSVTPVDADSANGSTARQNISSHLSQLQITKFQSTYSEQSPISLESERIITDKIKQLSQLESPQLRELAQRLGSLYGVETPRHQNRAPSPYAHIDVGARWEEIQGSKSWAGLLDPIDPVLRAEIVRYGEFAQATYDSFDSDTTSRYCGSCKHTQDRLLDKAGLHNRGYEITDYLYATSEISVPSFFSKSIANDPWSKDSNWIGCVAVCTSPEEIARLGRRDIFVSWRGTIEPLEWVEDVQDYLSPAGFDPRNGDSKVYVESGFLSLYTSSNPQSRYNKTSARYQVLGAVKRLVEKYRDEGKLSITLVGHSLGSALATLCAYDIAQSGMNLLSGNTPLPESWNSQTPKDVSEKGSKKSDVQPVSESKFSGDRIPVTVFSFGGPRVGNEAFKDMVDQLGVAVLRVANTHDVVPKVPGYLTAISPYKHVGEQITVDNLKSSYLVETTNHADVHNLELYMNLVDGYHGTALPFKPTLRDYALVNKGGNFLKKEYYIPPSWWQEKNKGLVRDKDGHWVVPVRNPQLYPETASPAKSTEEQKAAFERSVSIAVKRSQDKMGIEPQVDLPVVQGQATPSAGPL